MGKGPLKAHARFDISSPEDLYWVNVELGEMSMTELNPLVENQALIHISRGNLKKLQFEYAGDSDHTDGTLDFEYTDLKLSKLEDFHTIQDKNPKNGFLIGIANLLVPRNHVSTVKKGYETGKIYVIRDPQRDFFSVLIESLSAGILSNMGIGPKDPEKAALHQQEKEAKKAAKEVKKEEKAAEKEAKKHDRQEKRDAKKQAREEKKQEKAKKKEEGGDQ